MRIYLEDGELYENKQDIPLSHIPLDAKKGYSYCINKLEQLKSFKYSFNVYTNFSDAIKSRYSWNKNIEKHEVYVRDRVGDFVRIDTLTEKDLNKTHDVVKMWKAGNFND